MSKGPSRAKCRAAPVTPPKTELRQRFVEEYLVDFNGARAAEAAGCKPTSARRYASDMLRLPDVRAAIDARLAELADGARLKAEAILLETAKLAFSDIGEIMDFSGDVPRLRPSHEISSDARRSIESIKVKRTVVPGGIPPAEVEIIEFKLHSKATALQMLGRYRKLFVDRVEHSGEVKGGGVLLVPGAVSINQWSITAQAQQEVLAQQKIELAAAHDVSRRD